MISIIIPVYNTADYIDRCLSSIVNQSEGDFEIILIDDCSSDGSREKLKQWEEKDHRIHVIYKDQNAGVSAARNDGLLKARGSYITFIDSDDQIRPDYFKTLLYHLENTDADIAFGRFERVCSDHVDEMKPKKESGEIMDLNEAAGYCFPQMGQSWFDGYIWDKLYRREVIFKDGKPVLFDSSIHFAEDSLWLMNVMMNMNKGVVVNEAIYGYDCIRTSSAHHAVYDHGDAKLAKDAILVYEKIQSLLKDKGLSVENNVLQRKIIYQKLTCRGAAASGDRKLLRTAGKDYTRNLGTWFWKEKSLYALKWSTKQLGAYYADSLKAQIRSKNKQRRG